VPRSRQPAFLSAESESMMPDLPDHVLVCATCADVACPECITDEMVERMILAASDGVEGCFVPGAGHCGGTHTHCYYRGLLAAALTRERS
jgi:hypothetical protein